MTGDWKERADRLAADALAAGDPTGWFDRLYAAGRRGEVGLPWDRTTANPVLTAWARESDRTGTGERALVVGCSLGLDAEFVATLGYDTVAFDVSGTAIQIARERRPDSAVRYQVADLLEPPDEWTHGFDLVVEIYTVQALPRHFRARATGNVARMVAPGGTLFVLAAAHREDDTSPGGPPWPLTRAEIDEFAADGLGTTSVVYLEDSHWLGQFQRPGS